MLINKLDSLNVDYGVRNPPINKYGSLICCRIYWKWTRAVMTSYTAAEYNWKVGSIPCNEQTLTSKCVQQLQPVDHGLGWRPLGEIQSQSLSRFIS